MSRFGRSRLRHPMPIILLVVGLLLSAAVGGLVGHALSGAIVDAVSDDSPPPRLVVCDEFSVSDITHFRRAYYGLIVTGSVGGVTETVSVSMDSCYVIW